VNTRAGPTLGVLLVDSIDEPHRSIAGDYATLYASMFAHADIAVEPIDVRGGDLPDPQDLDGWVIGGSRHSVYEDLDWITGLADWVRSTVEARHPLIGICFGHQMIATALGGRVERWSGGWNLGAIEYQLCAVEQPTSCDQPFTCDQPFACDQPTSLRLLASHQDQVTMLPDGAQLLATAATCEIAGFTLADHVICLQGHPEFVPELAASLYRSRANLFGEEATARAVSSLSVPVDNAAAARLLATVAR
jgi:GMP synthase-like glutamine amidotransferase